MLHHFGGEGALAGGVAQFLQFPSEVTVQGNPPFQLPPCYILGEGGAVELCQLRSSVCSRYTIHKAKILKINELRKLLSVLFIDRNYHNYYNLIRL